MAAVPSERPRVAVLTNMVAPYRRPLFEALGNRFDLHVVLSGQEANRSGWADVMDHGRQFRVHRLKGLQLTFPRSRGAARIDQQRIHLSFGLLSTLCAIRPDAIVSAEMGFRTIAALLYTGVRRVPVWIWWGGTLHSESIAGRARVLLRRCIVRTNPRWISYGRSSTDYLLALGVSSDRILTIQNTVDSGRFTPEGERTFDFQPKPSVLTVGGLIPRKGLRELLDSANRLWHAGHAFSVAIAGDGLERDSLACIVAPRFRPLVRFLGQIPADAMPGLYRSADAFIFPTLEDVWGLAVNEAILCGLPVACSVYAGCAAELLDASAVFDPLQPASIDDALLKLIQGRIPQPDRSRVWTIQRAAEAITDEIDRVLRLR